MDDTRNLRHHLYIFIVLFVFWAILSILSSCSPRVITVEKVRTEYVSQRDTFIMRDSIHVLDSVFVKEKGDTFWVERYKVLYRDRWREKVVCDTVIRQDSIPYIVEIEKPLSWWSRKKIEFGEFALLLLAGLLFFMVIRHKFK